MPSLREILNDPNYTNANQATKEAIFNKYAPQDTDYTGANEATQQAIKQRFGLAATPEKPQAPEEQEESGFFRQAADIPVGFAKGVAGGVRMIADVFGAGSNVSEGIKGVEDYLGGLLSAQAKNDQKEVSRIMKEAEDKGVADQVLAGVKAFTVAPIDTLTQALGTSAPAIVAGLATTLTGGAPLVVAGVTAGVGAGMGAGAIKGTIYEATKEELIKAGVKPDVAEKAATEAQNYGGENLDQILLGAGIGAVAARTGIERAILGKAITKDVAKKGVTRAAAEEAAPEAVQAGQEQIAENLALQRQGFDVPLTRGVYSAATLEALAGAGLGAGVDLATRGEDVDKGPRTKEDDQIDALRNMKAEEDMGEVISPETKDATRQPEQKPVVRDDGRAVEPSVSMPAGTDEAAAGVVETEAGGVGGVGGAAVQPAVRAGEVDTTLEATPTPPITTPAPEETISAQQGQPSLAITPSGTLGLKDLVKIEDEKLQTKFEEISAGKKKVYRDKGYTPLFQELQQTIDGLSQFLVERGVDPTNLADLREGTPEIQNAAKLLNALGQDASNITQAVKNQEIKYASAKTPEAKAQVSDQFVKNNLESARQTIQTVNDFIQDPSKGTGQLAVFSNVREAAPGTRGSEARLVREAVGQIVQDWENAPRVEVVQSISELPGYMQEQILRDKVNPQGAYDPVSNLVFLVGDNLRGREDVFTTVAHEALGHFGLRSILGDSYNRVMNEIYNGHKDVKKAADEKMKGTAKVSKEIAVEEVLAEMAETEPKPTPALRRLFDAIRRFARKLGIPLRTVTDSDLQQLVANASRYVRRNAMKFDPFTKGQVQPGGPRAVKGVESVYSQGFKTPAGPARVNPGNAPTLMEKLSKGRPLWPEVKGKFNLKAITSLPPSAKQGMYKLLTLRMLKDIVGARLPQIGRAITVSEQMVSERGRIMRDGADILDKLEVLRKEKNGGKQIRLLGELQVQATMLEIDPDPKSKFHKPNKTLTDAWNTLSPKAQEIYQDMREFYTTQVDGMVDDMKARIDRNFPGNPAKATQLKKEIDDEFGPSKRKGPYFPLRRFGQYWFQVGKGDDKEFYMFESINDRDFWMAERAKELVADGQAQTEQEAIQDLISAGNSLREGEDSLNNALANEPLMKKIEALVDDAAKTMTTPNMQTKAVDDLKDGLKQLQYLLLPSTNIRKAFIHRKGIAGASADVGRVFSTSVVNLAYQRARVKYAEQFYDNIDNAYGFLEGASNTEETRTLRDLVNELNGRSAHILGMEPTSVSDKVANGVTQFSFLWLLTAPASSIINVFGAATVGSSYIGARYGYPETFAKMTKYGGKYFATAPKVKEGNTVFPTLDKTTSLNPVERAAYDRFLHDNAVDVSLTQDIMGLSQAPYEQYSTAKFKLVQGISSIFHHSERMSREVMNMAAFDLAYADNVKKGMAPGVDGPAFNAAIETAKDLTFMSIGDFSRSGKPPVLTKPAAKVLFQFKQYSLLMTYNILRNTMIGFNPKAKNLTDEQKAEAREARRRMYGTLGITALFAGAKGMPIFTAVAFLAEALQTAFGDDEEEYIFEYAMKEYLTESFGGEVAASMMTGLIANQLNVGISERMSLDLVDLWIRDSGYQRSAEDSTKEFLLSNLGPAVSIGLNATKAIDQFNNSQEMRALETASPIIARNLLTVGRWIREEENATARGITIDDDITYSDLAVKALGFTPEDMLRKQKEIIDRKGLESKIEYKRERLLGALYVALHTGDDDLFEATMEKVADFNEKYPEIAIEDDTIEKSLERKLEDKSKQEALGGVGEKLYGRIERAIPRSE